MRSLPFIILKTLLFVTLLFASSPSLFAANAVWNSVGSTDLTLPANYVGATNPSGNQLVFDSGTATQFSPNLGTGQTLTVTGILFQTTVHPYSLNMNSNFGMGLVVNGNISNPAGGVPQTIAFDTSGGGFSEFFLTGNNSDLITGSVINYTTIPCNAAFFVINGSSLGNFGNFTINANGQLTLAAGATLSTFQLGALTMGTGCSFSSSLLIDGGTGGANLNIGSLNTNTTINGFIQEINALNGTITKEGTGTLRIALPQSYTRATSIVGGILQAGVVNPIDLTKSVTIGSSGTYDLNSINQQLNNLSGAPNSHVTLGTGNLLLNVTASGLNFAGVISGSGSVTLSAGAPSYTLSGTNTYTGSTNISNGATLVAGAPNVVASSIGFNIGNGSFDMSGAGFDNQVNTLNGSDPTSKILIGDNTLTINQLSLGTFNGAISDGGLGGSVIVEGVSSLFLGGANSYTGGTTISPTATLIGTTTSLQGNILNNSALTFFQITTTPAYTGVISGSGIVTINGGLIGFTQPQTYTGVTTIFNGTLQDQSSGGNIISTSSSLIIDNTGIFDLNNHDNAINDLTSSSPSSSITLGSGVLTINQNSTLVFDGAITSTTGGGVTMNGPATLELFGSNNYNGLTTIAGGSLQAHLPNVFSSASNVNILSGGELDLLFYDNTIGSLSGVAGGSVNLGTGVLTVQEAGATTFGGIISSTGVGNGLTLEGGGTLTLSGANTYDGLTTIDNGTLLAGATNTFSNLSPVTISATGILSLATFSNEIGSLSGVTGSSVNLGTAGLTVNETTPSGPTTFSGIISSTGTGNSFTLTGNSTLTLAGVNTYTGPTVVTSGTLQAGIANAISSSSSLNIQAAGTFDLDNISNTVNTLSGDLGSKITLEGAVLTINQLAAGNFQGVISSTTAGNGIIKQGSGTLTLSGANTFTGPTSITAGILQAASSNALLDSSSLTVGASGTFDVATSTQINTLIGAVGSKITLEPGTALTVVQNSNAAFDGVISGTSGSLIKQGPSTLTLTGANIYGGGTTVTQGILEGNTTSLQGLIDVTSGGTLEFNQKKPGTFRGQLSGSGLVVKQGTGTLTFNTDQSPFSGTTSIDQGALNLQTALGGNVDVNNKGTLQGNGTVLGNLNAFAGGIVAPSPPFQTLTVGNTYNSMANSVLELSLDPFGNNTKLQVNGVANLAGDLAVFPAVPFINATLTYTLLHADTGLTGTFAAVFLPTNAQVIPTVTYDYTHFNVFLQYKSNLVGSAVTENEKRVAEQIDSITNPTPDQTLVINTLVNLRRNDARLALDDISGEQYSYLTTTNIYSTERFSQRIYDAVRTINRPCWCPNPCETLEPWFQIERGVSFAQGNPSSASMRNDIWDLTLGVNYPFSRQIIFGGALTYEQDQLRFKQGGKMDGNIWQGSLYTLIRSKKAYFFGDVMVGGGWGKLHRDMDFSVINVKSTSKPSSAQGYVYGEFGYNFPCKHLLAQPYFAAAYGYYRESAVKETGANALNLKISPKTNNLGNFYLGSHFSTNIAENVELSCDLAWHHRFGYNRFFVTNEFTTFGKQFKIDGSRIGNDAAQVSLNANVLLCNRLTLNLEFSGERWVGWSSYTLDLMFSYIW